MRAAGAVTAGCAGLLLVLAGLGLDRGTGSPALVPAAERGAPTSATATTGTPTGTPAATGRSAPARTLTVTPPRESRVPTPAAVPAVTVPALPADAGQALPPHGCLVPDPSGTGGCISPGMGVLMAAVIRTFGDLPASCWDPRDGDPWSDHPKGRACDYTMGRIGRYAGPEDVARGWQLAQWLRVNHTVLHVNYVIWQGRIWSRGRDAEGWRVYTGGGHYATTGPTNGHYDHVHVSTVD